MCVYRQRRMAEAETPKIETPKLTDEQILILSALFVLNATEGYVAAIRWLSDFESENGLSQGELDGFLDIFEGPCLPN